MPGSVTITEAQGQPAIPPDADYALCVIGTSTDSPFTTEQLSIPYAAPTRAAADYGIGDGIDALTQAITATQGNPAPPSAYFFRTPATTPGVRGVLDDSGVIGTAVIAQTADTPVGSYEPIGYVIDDGNDGAGGTIGTPGIVIQFSPDGGRTRLPSQLLGTSNEIEMLISGVGTGVKYAFGIAALVAIATEIRQDLLDHLADAPAVHNVADTSPEQVALNASSPPTDVASSIAVLNLARAAFGAHRVNDTVHDGGDLLNVITAPIATDYASGVALATDMKAKLNVHFEQFVAAAPAALLALTASVAAPVSYTDASLLAAGIAALDDYPRAVTVTTDAGGTPADMADTADFAGDDVAGSPQTELAVALSQVGGTVSTTGYYRGTDLMIDLVAGDGTGASYSIGIAAGIHNAADTRQITSPDPGQTLLTGDTWSESYTKAPQWAVSDLYTAGPTPTGVFADIAKGSAELAILALTEPVAVGDIPTLTAGLNYLAGPLNKRVLLMVRFRDPLPGETDTEYTLAVRAFRTASADDDRIQLVAGHGWLTDAFRSFRYFRSGLSAVLARMQSMQVVPGGRGEKIAQHPGYVARGPLENFSIVDDDGNLIPGAHDELIQPGIDGPINSRGGALTFYQQRISGLIGTYVSKAPVMHPATSKIFTSMDRRVANALEQVAVRRSWQSIQGAVPYSPTPTTGTVRLDQDFRDAIGGSIAGEIKARYALEIQNAEDPNLASIDELATLSGADIAATGVLRPLLYGYLNSVVITFDGSR